LRLFPNSLLAFGEKKQKKRHHLVKQALRSAGIVTVKVLGEGLK
jgi:lauroyl/myristoyl acyltransferase